jgi:hypothetical protein
MVEKKITIVEICLFYMVVFWMTEMKHFDDADDLTGCIL